MSSKKCNILSCCSPTGATFQTAQTGWVWPEPSTLRAPPRGGLCNAENVYLLGDKEPNLGVGGQLGGEVPVLGFPHIRWGK